MNGQRRLEPIVAAAVSAVLIAAAVPLHAYLKLGTQVDDRVVTLEWPRLPISYFVNEEDGADFTAEGLRQTLDRAFRTWEDIESSRVSFQFDGFTRAQPLDQDDRNTIGFLHRPDLDRVLASTNFLVDTQTGEIIESDIFFNTEFSWSSAQQGAQGRFDLESIALHEIGHFLGLGHSAVGETELQPGGGRRVIAAGAALFPIAFSAGNVTGRELRADDIAGASDMYPTSDFRRETGSIQGRVLRDGRGVFGAHIVAFDMRTGHLVGTFSLDDDGEFVVAGLRPGPYVVRVEPLDDGDLDSYFDEGAEVETDFGAAFHDRLVVVPRGGGSERIEITVRRR